MTHTAIRRMLSALAAAALASTFAKGPASAGDNMNTFQFIQKEMHASKPKTPKGFATQRPRARAYIHNVDPEGRLKINTPTGE